MPNTPDTQTLGAVNVTDLYTNFPKQITEREYFVIGTLDATKTATLSFNGMGMHAKTGISPVHQSQDSLGMFSLVSLAGAGGTVHICADGEVRCRTAAGAESAVSLAPATVEPEFSTVMGAETAAGNATVPGSAAARAWTLTVARVDADELTITMTDTTANPDRVWNATVDVVGIVGTSMEVFCGNPAAIGVKNGEVQHSTIDAFVTAAAIA